MKRTNKVISIEEAINMVKNGDTIGIGGFSMKRHPMALINEMIRQKKRELILYGWNNSIDFDALIGAGCTKEVHTSYVAFEGFGLAPNFRRAAEESTIKIVEETESTGQDRFKAAAMGLTFLPSKTPLATDMKVHKEFQKDIICPFTGEKYVALEAWNPDFVFIHAHSADIAGNIRLDERRFPDTDLDIITAYAGKKVIVSVEEIVDHKFILEDPRLTVLPSTFVDAVVEAPYGAHPCSCDRRYEVDEEYVNLYNKKSKSSEEFNDFLNQYIMSTKNHDEYLVKIGLRNLLELRRPKKVLENE